MFNLNTKVVQNLIIKKFKLFEIYPLRGIGRRGDVFTFVTGDYKAFLSYFFIKLIRVFFIHFFNPIFYFYQVAMAHLMPKKNKKAQSF